MRLFLSYTRSKDQFQKVSQFRERLEAEVCVRDPGSTVFQDTHNLSDGAHFPETIAAELQGSDVLLALVSPAWLKSEWCRREFALFTDDANSEARLHRILPVLWVDTPELSARSLDLVARSLAGINYSDWRDLRYESWDNSTNQRQIGKLAESARAIVQASGPSAVSSPEAAVRLPQEHEKLASLNSADLHRIEVFLARNSSDAQMTADLARSARVKFFGVSQKHLHVYLESIFSAAEERSNRLEDIDVFFAADADGTLWEGGDFRRTITHVRHHLAEMFTSEQWKVRPASRIRFFQATHHMTYGGCLAESSTGSLVAYVANYLPSAAPNAMDSLTFRFQASSDGLETKSVAYRYVTGFRHIASHAKSLGSVKLGIWDRSVTEWARFASNCQAHQDSMRHATSFAAAHLHGRVLDVACADGTTSRLLLQALPNGSHLTVLDASPQMLAKAKATLLSSSVAFALGEVPGTAVDEVVDLVAHYDAIVLHLALSVVAIDDTTLLAFAQWCKNMLAQTGVVLIAAHNTSVRIAQDAYSRQSDPLRQALSTVFADVKACVRKTDQASRLDPSDVEGAFCAVGLPLVKDDERSFPMTMSDRLLMWSAPAVLDSLFDVSRTNREERRQRLEQVARSIHNLPTAPMVVKYWLFGAQTDAA